MTGERASKSAGYDGKRRLRVGILTLPFHVNYGGIIQAAALYRFLSDSGYDPVLLNRKPNKSFLSIVAGQMLKRIPGQNIANVRRNEKIRSVHYPFIEKYLPNRTDFLRDSNSLQRSAKELDLAAVIVGSDQVWRIEYHNYDQPLAYFLDFVDPSQAARIAYAASFGTPRWDHSHLNENVSDLLRSFSHISVREQSGARICTDLFKIDDPKIVLDPTLIVGSQFYDDIADCKADPEGGYVLEYILDREQLESRIPDRLFALGDENIPHIIIDPHTEEDPIDIREFLNHFRSARLVVTDSYHGTIFAILNKKQFLTIDNPERGSDRLTGLLQSLGLEDRLVASLTQSTATDVFSRTIDYVAVFDRLSKMRAGSRAFLTEALEAAASRFG